MKTFRKFLKESSDILLRKDDHYAFHHLTPEHIDWISNHPSVKASTGATLLTLPPELPHYPMRSTALLLAILP
jgi:hypothetical protein